MIWVAGSAVALAAQGVLAMRFKSTIRLLLFAQIVYWGLAFVVRPIYLRLTQPISPIDLGDYRLSLDAYGATLDRVAYVAFVGQVVYVLALYICLRLSPAVSSSHAIEHSRWLGAERVGLIVYIVGWIGRLASLAGLGPVASALEPLADCGAGLLIVYTSSARRVDRWWVGVFIAEIAWSFLDHSKESLIAPILALIIRFTISGSKRTLRRFILIAVPGALAGFFSIQSLRGIDTAQSVAEGSSGFVGVIKGGFVGLLERFDGFTAVTDAVALGPFHWLTGGQAISRAILFAIPKGPWATLDTSLGQLWTREVKSQTFVNQYQDVSLAAGPTAEGYALAGWAGLLVENILLAAVVVFIGWALASSNLPLRAAAIYVALSTVLYEQGAYGVISAANKATQIAIIVAVLASISMRLNARASGAAVSRIPSGRETATDISQTRTGRVRDIRL